ncbi:MAG: hypothetical protein MJ252_22565 [archaeon]|nr:hypothetical protein [archaeon]
MGCCGNKNLDVFEYKKHMHRLVKGNENHSTCELCGDDIPAGFSYFCELCQYNICIECKKKEEILQNEEAEMERKIEEERSKKQEEEERQKKREGEERKRKKEAEK